MLIHQESIIAATPQAIYEALTDGQKFAAATGMPAQLSDREGETFTLFGGRVEGRQIELVPGQRIVQAWRFGATHPSEWDAGVYSVVRFTLSGLQDGTRLITGPGRGPWWRLRESSAITGDGCSRPWSGCSGTSNWPRT